MDWITWKVVGSAQEESNVPSSLLVTLEFGGFQLAWNCDWKLLGGRDSKGIFIFIIIIFLGVGSHVY